MIEFVKNFAVSGVETNSAKVFISGDVDDKMVDELNADIAMCREADIKSITFVINSPGGSVKDGMAMYDIVSALTDITTTAEIQGICASAATYVALACDKVTIGAHADMMLHEPEGGFAGTLEQVENDCDYFANIRNRIIAIYCSKTGWTVEECVAVLKAAKFLTASECLEMRLVDEIIGSTETEEAPKEEPKGNPAEHFYDKAETEDKSETESTNGNGMFSLKNLLKFLKDNKVSFIQSSDDEMADRKEIENNLRNEITTLKAELEAKNKSYDELVARREKEASEFLNKVETEVANRIASMGYSNTDLPRPSKSKAMDDGEFHEFIKNIYTTKGYKAAEEAVHQRERGEI